MKMSKNRIQYEFDRNLNRLALIERALAVRQTFYYFKHYTKLTKRKTWAKNTVEKDQTTQ